MHYTIALNENKDFKRIYNRGRNFVTKLFVLYVRKNNLAVNRLGITVSKKIGKAVKRNRARRLLYEAYRLCEMEYPIKTGYDLVLVARSRMPFVNLFQTKKAMLELLKAEKLLNI